MDWVVIGRFGRPKGLDGLMTVHSFTDPPDNIFSYQPWHVLFKQSWQSVTIINIEITAKHFFVQVDDEFFRRYLPTKHFEKKREVEREERAILTNCDIAIPLKKLPSLPPTEYYWYELVGMNVVNSDNVSFGNVTQLIPTGSNDVLVVEGERRRLIPYIFGQVIKNIDRDHRTILVHWDADF